MCRPWNGLCHPAFTLLTTCIGACFCCHTSARRATSTAGATVSPFRRAFAGRPIQDRPGHRGPIPAEFRTGSTAGEFPQRGRTPRESGTLWRLGIARCVGTLHGPLPERLCDRVCHDRRCSVPGTRKLHGHGTCGLPGRRWEPATWQPFPTGSGLCRGRGRQHPLIGLRLERVLGSQLHAAQTVGRAARRLSSVRQRAGARLSPASWPIGTKRRFRI